MDPWLHVDPAWSPDGRRIAFSAINPLGGRHLEAEVYVMNADGSALARLTNGAANEFPAWSPDGRRRCRRGWLKFERRMGRTAVVN